MISCSIILNYIHCKNKSKKTVLESSSLADLGDSQRVDRGCYASGPGSPTENDMFAPIANHIKPQVLGPKTAVNRASCSPEPQFSCMQMLQVESDGWSTTSCVKILSCTSLCKQAPSSLFQRMFQTQECGTYATSTTEDFEPRIWRR